MCCCQEMEIVVTKHRHCAITEIGHETQGFQRLWATVDEVACEPETIVARAEVQFPQQGLEFTITALDITDGIAGQATISVENAGYGECERRYLGVKLDTVVCNHLVTSVHAADSSFNHSATRVLERLTRTEVRLLADHAVTADLLCLAITVGDNPVARKQLRWYPPCIVNGYRIGEDVTVLIRNGLGFNISRFDTDLDVIRGLICHLAIFRHFSLVIHPVCMRGIRKSPCLVAKAVGIRGKVRRYCTQYGLSVSFEVCPSATVCRLHTAHDIRREQYNNGELLSCT